MTPLEARIAALERENAALRAELARDPLTGLLNRRAMEQRLAAVPPGSRATLAFIDVDRFKEVNGAHGYGAGDRLLAAVAAALDRALAGAVLARWGGDEFVALFAEGTGATDAIARARSEVAETVATAAGPAPTFSAGVAGVRDTVAAWLDAADEALRAGKAAGGDRTVVAQP